MINFKINLSEISTIVVVLIAAALFFVIDNDLITILIAICSIIYAFIYFKSDAERNMGKDNSAWIYPGILCLVTFILGYILTDKAATHAFYFFSVIMLIRSILNLLYTIVWDTLTKQLNRVFNSIEIDIKASIEDMQKQFKTAVIPVDIFEKRLNSIRQNSEQKLNAMTSDLSKTKADLKVCQAKIEQRKKLWEEKFAAYKQEIIDKNAEIDQMRAQQDEFIKKQQAKAETQNYALENQAIREKFDEALKIAQKEVDIFSPWVSKNVVDEFMVAKFRNLLDKGVTLKIRYGIGSLSGNAKQQQNRNDTTEACIKYLKRELKAYPNFKVYKDNSHAKLFICDDKYYVISSFNILSFKGDYKGDDLRRELGEYSENKELLNQYRKHYFDF